MRRPAAQQAGFTLIELVLVMGMLAGFLAMLVQILSAGTELYSAGEASQEMADRARTTRHRVQQVLESIAGPQQPTGEWAGNPDPEARVVLQRLDLPRVPERTDLRGARVPFLRASVRLDQGTEAQLVREQLMAEILQSPDPVDDPETELARLLAVYPFTGRGTLLLWLDRGDETGFLELRRMVLPTGGLLVLDPDGQDLAGPFDIRTPFTERPGWRQMREQSGVWCDRLLFLDLELLDPTPRLGMELRWRREWDTARAGWFFEEKDPDFPYDMGPDSLGDPRDDLWPRAVRVTAVVGRPTEVPPVSRLGNTLGTSERSMVLIRTDTIPDPGPGGGFVKVGDEWIRYTGVSGRTLSGLTRGVRETVAAEHPRGAPIRVGRTLSFTLPIHAGRGDSQ